MSLNFIPSWQPLTEMSKIATKWGGTIDKFIGDAMLVFFGDPSSNGSKNDAKNCVAINVNLCFAKT